MRGLVPGLLSGVPIALRLPGVYQEEDFTQRFVSSFDDALAPVMATLDGLSGYVDPGLAPSDFLDWLAGWVGVEVDDAWTLPQRRAIVAGAALLHRQRGTARGIAAAVRLVVPARCQVEVVDSGTAEWSTEPGQSVPGTTPPLVTVTLLVSPDDTERVDVPRVEALVASVKPAHVPHRVRLAVVAAEPSPEHPQE